MRKEEVQFSRGFKKLQMYAEFFMGGFAMILLMLYADGKYTHYLPLIALSQGNIFVFCMLMICTLFAGHKAFLRLGKALTELKSTLTEFQKFRQESKKLDDKTKPE